MMNDDEFQKIVGTLQLRQPANRADVENVERECSVTLPRDYVDFMLRSNGAEGAVGNDGYVSLWPVEEIIEMNAGYRVPEFAPGLLLFGSDGGGEAFAFDTRDASMPIVGVPFVGMCLADAEPVAESFSNMLSSTW